MAKSTTSITKPAQGASDGAAAFADGHIDPVRPTADAVAGDPVEAVRQAERVSLQEDVLDPGSDVPAPGFILVVCGQAGFRRGGMMHPPRAEYPLDAFTAEQLALFRAEPKLHLVEVGGSAIPRHERLFGAESLVPARPYDPLLAGQAAADAISRPPNRSEPGLRNAVAGFSTR